MVQRSDPRGRIVHDHGNDDAAHEGRRRQAKGVGIGTAHAGSVHRVFAGNEGLGALAAPGAAGSRPGRQPSRAADEPHGTVMQLCHLWATFDGWTYGERFAR